MQRLRLFLVVWLTLAAGCPFAVPRLADGEYRCASDEDCVAGFVCHPALGLCIDKVASVDGGLLVDSGSVDGGDDDGGPSVGADGGPSCPPGADLDGDGRGEGCAWGPDCDDDDAERWARVVAFEDADGDGWYGEAPTLLCSDGSAPDGYTLEVPAAFDCDDDDDARAPWRPGWADLDGDGAAGAEPVRLCTDGALPAGYLADAPEVADCDDTDARRQPDAPEVCDAVDNDCDGFADDGEGVCPCPVHWHRDPLHPYQRCESSVSWGTALSACGADDRPYHLVIVESYPEDHFLRGLRAGVGVGLWLGLYDGNGGAEGQHVWVDGSPLAVDGWRGGEPNNGGALGNEDCVEMTETGWNDEGCGSGRFYVCEGAPEPPVLEPLFDAGPGPELPPPGGGGDPAPDCVDEDGDGWFGRGCDPSPDCDDGDASRWLWLVGWPDDDGDGFTRTLPVLTCTDGALPAGLAPEASSLPDCDDEDPGVSDALPGWPDDDGDGAPAAAAEEVVCQEGALPPGYFAAAPAVGDCDDDDASRSPLLLEDCNGRDDDCSGVADDGEGICPCPVVGAPGDPLHPYLFCGDRQLHWEWARWVCQTAGYDLVVVEDEGEGGFLRAEAEARGGLWWLGLTDLDDEGSFVWVDGTPVGYDGWQDGEPNNLFFVEHCAVLDGTGWNDSDCLAGARFICEPRP